MSTTSGGVERVTNERLVNLLKKICSNAYACSYQQNTFPGESDPCGKCANCMADEVLGENWEKAEVPEQVGLSRHELLMEILKHTESNTVAEAIQLIQRAKQEGN